MYKIYVVANKTDSEMAPEYAAIWDPTTESKGFCRDPASTASTVCAWLQHQLMEERKAVTMEMEKHSFGDVQADDETKQHIGLKSFIDEQGRNRLDLEMPGIGTFVCVVSLEDGGSFIGENYIPAPYEKGSANGHGP